MDSTRFQVICHGRITQHKSKVAQHLQERFHLSEKKIATLMSGKSLVLRSNIEHKQANKLKNSMAECGVICEIRLQRQEVASTTKKTVSVPTPALPKATASNIKTNSVISEPKQPKQQAQKQQKQQKQQNYPLIAPLWLSLYSQTFYRNIVHQWSTGRAFLYMLLLVLVTQIPMVGYIQVAVHDFVTEYSDLIVQLPDIHINTDKTMTTDCDGICILQHAGKDYIIIDPNGVPDDLANTEARMLFNGSSLLTRQEDGTIENKDLDFYIDVHINRELVQMLLPYSNWIWLVSLLTLGLVNYILFCIKALIYGWIATYRAKKHKVELSFSKLLVIVIPCLTPVALLDAVLTPWGMGVPFIIGLILTIIIINLAIRSYTLGYVEQKQIVSRQANNSGDIVQQEQDNKTQVESFYYSKKYWQYKFGMLGFALIPLLFLMFITLNDTSDESANLFFFMGIIIVLFFVFMLIIFFVRTKSPFVTLDEKALRLQDLSILWSEIRFATPKTTNFFLFKYHSLAIKGTFKVSIIGNSLEIPLSLLAEPERLQQAILMRIPQLDSTKVRQRAAKVFSLDDDAQEGLNYKNIRFSKSGIHTNQLVITWRQVQVLQGQAGVVAGMGSFTIIYANNSSEQRSLVIKGENTKQYQQIIAFSIAAATVANVDEELINYLTKNTQEAGNEYLLMGLTGISLLLPFGIMFTMFMYNFGALLPMLVLIGGMIISLTAAQHVLVSASQGEYIPLRKRKFWAWSAASFPIIILLFGMLMQADARHWILGDMTAKWGSFANSEAHYKQALQLSDNSFDVLFDLGLLYKNNGYWQKAYECLDPPIRENINYWTADAVLFPVEMLQKMGKNDEAIIWCEKVLADDDISDYMKDIITSKLQELKSGLL